MGTRKNQKPSNAATADHGDVADPRDLVMLGAAALREILTPARCLAALEDAYRRLHAAPADGGRSLGFQTADGKFHVKAGLYPGSHDYFAAKVNANFPDNPERFGLPTIQGLIVLCDGANGRPVAILHSGELTGRRTAAATALAARHGARSDAATLAIVGGGAQARHQAAALADILPIRRVVAADRDTVRTEAFAAWTVDTLGLQATVASSIADAVGDGDVIVTCTTATRAIITPDMVSAGSFIAAVGADNPDKQELDPGLFTTARILVDDVAQCAEGGDLAHAIRAGTATTDAVAATLAQLAAGARPGRTADDEIVIFDSTGTGIQDVAAAVVAYTNSQPDCCADSQTEGSWAR
ncbi:MAG: ornithine cyclodeaminase family protein [Alphaproteobacteria bacterium]|nr:ornithine cyclodeaminase family protein [Alphaproteobacteria bacterium]